MYKRQRYNKVTALQHLLVTSFEAKGLAVRKVTSNKGKRTAGADEFDQWARLLLDQALLAEGAQIADPAAFVKRLNALLLK